MRNVFLCLIILFFPIKDIVAQEDPNVYSYSFFLNGTTNNKIRVENNSSYFSNGDLIFNVTPNVLSSFLYVNTFLTIMDDKTILFSKQGPSFNKSTDFHNNSNVSVLKQFSLDLDETLLSKIRNSHPNAKFVVRYTYTIMGGNKFPSISQGFEYFVSKKSYSFEFIAPIVPKAEITGANSFCNEAIYTVKNATNVYLENSTNLAIVSKISNDQWKVSKTGASNGEITLVAVNSAGVATRKVIKVENILLGTLNGSLNIQQGKSNTITFVPENGKSYSNYSWSINSSNLTYTVSANSLNVKVPLLYPLNNTSTGDNITATLNATGECGPVSKNFIIHIIPASSNYPLLVSNFLTRDGVNYDVAVNINSNTLSQLTISSGNASDPKAPSSYSITYSYHSDTQIKLFGTLTLNNGTVYQINDILTL